MEFRNEFINAGFPTFDKTNNANLLSCDFSERDFWRGVFDGDGSLGYTGDGIPFMPLATKSETLKEAFCKLLYDKFGIEKNIKRNTRDNIYNIVIQNEEAVILANNLYRDDDIYHLNRKYEKAKEMLLWVRTKPKRPKGKKYTEEEENFIRTHSIEECVEKLGRTPKAISIKKYRLEQKDNNKPCY